MDYKSEDLRFKGVRIVADLDVLGMYSIIMEDTDSYIGVDMAKIDSKPPSDDDIRSRIGKHIMSTMICVYPDMLNKWESILGRPISGMELLRLLEKFFSGEVEIRSRERTKTKLHSEAVKDLFDRYSKLHSELDTDYDPYDI